MAGLFELQCGARELIRVCLSNLPNFRGKGRITLLLDRLVTRTTESASYRVIGPINGAGQFCFDVRPWSQKFAYYYGEWEGSYTNVLRKLYDGGIFVDVGSSIGLYVVALGRHIRSCGGKIVAVEPVPFNLERLEFNVRLNSLEDIVTYVPVALGDRKATARMIVDSACADNNAIVSPQGTVEVPVSTLDELIGGLGIWPVTMLKIDVEGWEPMVLEGGRKIIQRDQPTIFAELNRERMIINRFSFDGVWRWLAEMGYRCYRLQGDRLQRLVEPGCLENLFFLPRHVAMPSSLVVRSSGGS